MSFLGRKYNKTVLTRPRKGGAAKRRRQADQKKRLIAMGMDEVTVSRLTTRDILTKLKYPAKLAKEIEASK